MPDHREDNNQTSESSDHTVCESNDPTTKPRYKIIMSIFRFCLDFEYNLSITIVLLLFILGIIYQEKRIIIRYVNTYPVTWDFFKFNNVVCLVLILYIIISLSIKGICNWLQKRSMKFSMTLYYFAELSKHITMFLICGGIMIVGYVYELVLPFKKWIKGELEFQDFPATVFLGNFLFSIISFVSARTTAHFNRNTYTERILDTFRWQYFIDLLDTICENRGNMEFVGDRSNIWINSLPWYKRAKKTMIATNEALLVKYRRLFNKKNDNDLDDRLREQIFDNFIKPSSNMFTTESPFYIPTKYSSYIDKKIEKLEQLSELDITKCNHLFTYFNQTDELFDQFLESLGYKRDTYIFKDDVLKNLLIKVYRERNIIKNSLRQINSGITNLQACLNTIICGLLVAYIYTISSTSTPVVVSIITAFFGTGFIFQSSIKNAMDSIIFLFCIHPYDVGDRVFIKIGDEVENMIVSEMNIFSTVFYKWDGIAAYVSNSILCTKAITNVRRSGKMAESHKIQIDSSTGERKLDILKNRIASFIKNNQHMYFNFFMLNFENIENSNKLNMRVFVQYSKNWQMYDEYLLAKKTFLIALNEMLRDLEITYALPVQKVRIIQDGRNVYDKMRNDDRDNDDHRKSGKYGANITKKPPKKIEKVKNNIDEIEKYE